MHSLDPSSTLGEIVTANPAAARVFERLGLDYCCHGAHTLHDAATGAGLDPQAVVAELDAAGAAGAADAGTGDTGAAAGAAWASFEPAELAQHVVATHHQYLWEQMPRVGALVDKIVAVHGDRHPELATVQSLYRTLRDDLEPHLTLEEQQVFPAIRRVTSDEASGADRDLLGRQLDEIGEEHVKVGALLEELRAVTSGYTPPADGCPTYVATYQGLAEMEADIHLHVHKENNVLMPRLRPVLHGSHA